VLQIFIAPPADPAAAIRARNWAWANGWPIEPGVGCPMEVIQLATPTMPFVPVEGVTYSIRWPEPNQGVYGVVEVLGTATFDPALVAFYKLEINGGDFLGSWLTFGETHNQHVVDGVLELLHADALTPGEYVIRLVLVGHDGNYIQPTFEVPIRVLSEPPTATPSPTP
jgi:hypothetical protein